MHRKTETLEIDIPKDDIECWEKYPKYRWVYEMTRLLDAQNIKWSPYKTDVLYDQEANIVLHSTGPINVQSGIIYVRKSPGIHMFSEMYISKWEIKLLRHIDPATQLELEELIGELELRLSAFATLYFQKFTGVIAIESFGNELVRICLRPHIDISKEANTEVIKLLKRIYKKADSTATHLLG